MPFTERTPETNGSSRERETDACVFGPRDFIPGALFLLGRILTTLQWLGLGLIVVSVMVMQLSALLQSRKTPPVPDRVAAGEAR